MNAQNDAIYQELVALDQIQQKTGRRNHKRHAEILMEMCAASNELAQRATNNTESALKSVDILMEKYNRLKLRHDSLEAANYELYIIMQAGALEAREHRC